MNRKEATNSGLIETMVPDYNRFMIPYCTSFALQLISMSVCVRTFVVWHRLHVFVCAHI